MIHWFSVDNFRSVRAEATVDLRIPGTTPQLPMFRTSASRPDVRLPTVVAFIGPNASGKTTLLRALTDVVDFAANSYLYHDYSMDAAFLPFMDPFMRTQTTRIEIDFDARWFGTEGPPASLCRYVLDIDRHYGHPRIAREALLTHPKGRPRRVFERFGDGRPVHVAREWGIRQSDQRLSAIPPSTSAVSALARMDMGPFPAIAQDLRNVQRNIVSFQPDPWRPDIASVVHFYRDNPNLLSRISEMLPRFDLGIEGVNVWQAPDSNWHLLFRHRGLDSPIYLQHESAGTRHLATVFPQLNFALEGGHVAIMDSLDSDFHPALVTEILEWFRRPDTNPNGAQLLCTLHNASILSDLEKEEIFIVEKDWNGVTGVYGAREVNDLRRNGDIHKWYRGGVLGGIPRFG